MKYNQLVGDCCRYLAAKNPTSTDADLTQFIGLQRLAEEVASTFGFDATIYETRYLGVDAVELSVKAFKSRLFDLKNTFPPSSTCLRKTAATLKMTSF